MDLDDSAVDVVPLKLEPGKPFRKVFEKTSADGGKLVGKIDRPDALPADNMAWAILPRRDVQPVTLVSDGNLFLEKVFEANPLVKLALTNKAPTTSTGGITVFHKNVPEKLPPGPVLVIEPTTSTDLWTIGEVQQNPIVTKQDKDSPLMAHVRLDNVLMPEARQLKITAPKFQALATSLTNDPLYASIDRPEGKVLVLTVNLEKGDLPLQTAFPIMVANAPRLVRRDQGGASRVALDRRRHRHRVAPLGRGEQRGPGPALAGWPIEVVASPGEQGDGRAARQVRCLVDRPTFDGSREGGSERPGAAQAAPGSGV